MSRSRSRRDPSDPFLADQTPGLFTRLDPHELPVAGDPVEDVGIPGSTPTLSESFRHSGWATSRRLIYHALIGTRQAVSRIARFCTCGVDAWVLRRIDKPDEFRLATSACRDRLCLPCSRDRAATIRHNVVERLNGRPCRFITLTLKGSQEPLAVVITRLLACFRRLRHRRFWSSHVKGGIGFVEFKWSPKFQGWHVHLHTITHGRYVPKQDLVAEWYAVTGDSIIVDIAFVRQEQKVIDYVTKYVTKPWERDDIHAEQRLNEIILGTKGKRLIMGFGDFADIKLTSVPSAHEWETFADLGTVVGWACNHDPDALEALHQVAGERAFSLMNDWHRYHQPHAPPEPDQFVQLTFAWPDVCCPF